MSSGQSLLPPAGGAGLSHSAQPRPGSHLCGLITLVGPIGEGRGQAQRPGPESLVVWCVAEKERQFLRSSRGHEQSGPDTGQAYPQGMWQETLAHPAQPSVPPTSKNLLEMEMSFSGDVTHLQTHLKLSGSHSGTLA